MRSEGQKLLFAADRPITARTADLLGRSDFAVSLARAMQGWTGKDSLVIALYGPWGSGKSSIKNMVLEGALNLVTGVKHLLSYLSADDARDVLIYHQKQLVAFMHAQMQAHYWEKATGYDVVVSKGFTALKPSAFTAATTDPVHEFRQTVQDKTRIAQMLFGGFQRCLYPIQKFQSDAERKLAIILDRDAEKWFKPARGQFQIYYKSGADHLEYQPDFVAETADCIYLLEAKARNDLDDAEVQAKKDAAVQWCRHATSHAVSHGGKSWQYRLIPHDVITENMTLVGLASLGSCS